MDEREEGVICGRPECGADESRIDGFCSIYCRDIQDEREEITRLEDALRYLQNIEKAAVVLMENAVYGDPSETFCHEDGSSGREVIVRECDISALAAAVSTKMKQDVVGRVKEVVNDIMLGFLFEENTEVLRKKAVEEISIALAPMRVDGSMVDYEILCDERNNPCKTTALAVDVRLRLQDEWLSIRFGIGQT